MMTGFEADLLITITTTLLTVVGWVAVRQEKWGRQVVRLEVKLENGITRELKNLRTELEAHSAELHRHAEGEEERILLLIRARSGHQVGGKGIRG